MLIREFIDKHKIKLEGTWQKFDSDFREAISKAKDASEIRIILRSNRNNLQKYHEADEKGWTHLMSDVWDKSFGTWEPTHKSDSPWAMAESAQDVDYVLGLLRNGIMVEDAADKLYDVLGYNELFEEIAAAKIEAPRTNFASQLANFIVKLPPKNDALKDMQDAIMHDSELAAMVTPPVDNQVQEGKTDIILPYVKALHEDLKYLKSLDRLDEQSGIIKTFQRAWQAGITTEAMTSRYLKEYKTANLLHTDNLSKSAFYFAKEYRAIKKERKLNKAEATQLLYRVAIQFGVSPTDLGHKVKEIFSGPKEIKREPVKTDWVIRHYTKEAAILQMPKRDHIPNLAGLVDLTANVLPSGSENKWHVALEQKYGKAFANWYIALMRYADHNERTPRYGQNEREIADYLNRNKEYDKDNIEFLSKHIQDIVALAKAVGMEHADVVRKELGEVFGRKQPEPEHKIKEPHDCPNCDGTGGVRMHGRDDTTCPMCHGKGIVESYDSNALKESVMMVLRRVAEGDHWYSAVEAVATNKAKHDALTHKMVQMGVAEAQVLSFQKPMQKKNKPNHLAYLSSWAKQFIDNESKVGHIRNELDAMELHNSVNDRVCQDMNVETADDWDSTIISFDKEFSKLYGMTPAEYIKNKKHVKESQEDSNKGQMINFPQGEKIKRVPPHVGKQDEKNDEPHKYGGSISDLGKAKLQRSISALKDFIDKTEITTDKEVDRLLGVIEKEEHRLGISYDTYSQAFAERFGKKIMPYVDHKFTTNFQNISGGSVNEAAQILQFKAHPKVQNDWNNDGLELFCKKIKQHVDKTDLSTGEAKDKLIMDLDAGLDAIKCEPKDFYIMFEKMFGEDFGMYIDKSAEDRGLNEGVEGLTAHRARVDISNMLRQYVDSSDINLLSNFESYEDQSFLSLKLNVHQNSARKLKIIVSDMIEKLKEDGFKEKDGGIMTKGDIMLKLKPIRKTFRTGPYKNRETPTWGIEVIGPKRYKK